MITEEKFLEVASLTLPQVMIELVYRDVMPLTMHSTAVKALEELAEFGYTGREIDKAKLHHCHFGDILGKGEKSSVYKSFAGRVERNGRNYRFLTSRGKLRGGEHGDYLTALKIQFLVVLEKEAAI